MVAWGAGSGCGGSDRSDSITGEMYPVRRFDPQWKASGQRDWRHRTFPPVRPPRQPFALDTPIFAFASLATLAARAPLGGPREIALAAYATARMAEDVGIDALPFDSRRTRAVSARRWLSTLTISDPVRRAFLELIAATETDARTTAVAVRHVIDVTSAVLDGPSRSDLDRLAKELESQTVGRT